MGGACASRVASDWLPEDEGGVPSLPGEMPLAARWRWADLLGLRRLAVMASPPPASPPTPVQIREANAHLAALHGRVAELEARLAAAEETVRGQAQSLIRKDGETRRAMDELSREKGREIAALEEKLRSSEDRVQELLGVIREKEGLILRLRHRSRLLGEICRCRPVLDTLLAQMSEGERLGPDSSGSSPDSSGLLPDSNCVPDGARDFSLGDDPQDSDKALFGTTV